MSASEFYQQPDYDPWAHDNGTNPQPLITYGDSTTAPPGVDRPELLPTPSPIIITHATHTNDVRLLNQQPHFQSGQQLHQPQPQLQPQHLAPQGHPQVQGYVYTQHPQQQYLHPQQGSRPSFSQPSPISPTSPVPPPGMIPMISSGPQVPVNYTPPPTSPYAPNVSQQQFQQHQQPRPQYPPSYTSNDYSGPFLAPPSITIASHSLHELDSEPQTSSTPSVDPIAQSNQANLDDNHRRQLEEYKANLAESLQLQNLPPSNQQLQLQTQQPQHPQYQQQQHHQPPPFQPTPQHPPIAYIPQPPMSIFPVPTSTPPTPSISTASSITGSGYPHSGIQNHPTNLTIISENANNTGQNTSTATAPVPDMTKLHQPAGHKRKYKRTAKRMGFLAVVTSVFCCCGAVACQGCMESCTNCADCCAEAMQ